MATKSAPFVTLHDGKKAPAPNIFGTVGELYDATIAIGTEGADASDEIRVTIQLRDYFGDDLATKSHLIAYLSSESAGDNVTATGPSTETIIKTDGGLGILLAKKIYFLTSESDGDIDITIKESSTATWYLVLCMPDGTLNVSAAITFA